MADKHHILVVDNTGEKPSNISFLLRLAGYKVSEFADELEACNWLLQKEPGCCTADMLVLHEPNPERSLLALLFQMRQRLPQLELMFVAPDKMKLSGQINDLETGVHQCTSGEVHGLTRSIFKTKPLTRQEEAPPPYRLQDTGNGRP